MFSTPASPKKSVSPKATSSEITPTQLQPASPQQKSMPTPTEFAEKIVPTGKMYSPKLTSALSDKEAPPMIGCLNCLLMLG